MRCFPLYSPPKSRARRTLLIFAPIADVRTFASRIIGINIFFLPCFHLRRRSIMWLIVPGTSFPQRGEHRLYFAAATPLFENHFAVPVPPTRILVRGITGKWNLHPGKVQQKIFVRKHERLHICIALTYRVVFQGESSLQLGFKKGFEIFTNTAAVRL